MDAAATAAATALSHDSELEPITVITLATLSSIIYSLV